MTQEAIPGDLQLSLGVEVFLRPHTPDLIAACLEEYAASEADSLLLFYEETTEKLRAFDLGKVLAYSKRNVRTCPDNKDCYVTLAGSERTHELTPFRFDLAICGGPYWKDQPTRWFRALWPVDRFESLETFRALVLRWLAPLPLLWGQGGFYFHYAPNGSAGGERIRSLTRRFLCPAIAEACTLKPGGVGWLTALGEESLAKLRGGRAGLEAKLTKDRVITVHPIQHGLVVQLGEGPILGDINTQEDVSAYRRLGQALRPTFPTRVCNYQYFDVRETLDWTRRFCDKGSRWPYPIPPDDGT